MPGQEVIELELDNDGVYKEKPRIKRQRKSQPSERKELSTKVGPPKLSPRVEEFLYGFELSLDAVSRMANVFMKKFGG